MSAETATMLRSQGWPVLACTYTDQTDYAHEVGRRGIDTDQHRLPYIIGSGFGEAYELRFHSPTFDQEVWAYVLTHADVDTYGQTVVICGERIEDEDRVADLFEAEQKAHRVTFRRAIEENHKRLRN